MYPPPRIPFEPSVLVPIVRHSGQRRTMRHKSNTERVRERERNWEPVAPRKKVAASHVHFKYTIYAICHIKCMFSSTTLRITCYIYLYVLLGGVAVILVLLMFPCAARRRPSLSSGVFVARTLIYCRFSFVWPERLLTFSPCPTSPSRIILIIIPFSVQVFFWLVSQRPVNN